MHTTTHPATTTETRRSAARFLSARVVAVRAELSETVKSPDRAGKAAMVHALRVDLAGLEARLAEAVVSGARPRPSRSSTA
jgi:hypothetical protein